MEPLDFGSKDYWIMFLVIFFARSMDFLSTWIATPTLALEGNPIAKRLGWKLGTVLNVVLCFLFASIPVTAIIISTTSILVAARNFQLAWLMRSMGEDLYRHWFLERLTETPITLYLFCLVAQTGLVGVVGLALCIYSDLMIPFSIGMGVLGYSFAVLFFTLLSLWRIRRQCG